MLVVVMILVLLSKMEPDIGSRKAGRGARHKGKPAVYRLWCTVSVQQGDMSNNNYHSSLGKTY